MKRLQNDGAKSAAGQEIGHRIRALHGIATENPPRFSLTDRPAVLCKTRRWRGPAFRIPAKPTGLPKHWWRCGVESVRHAGRAIQGEYLCSC